MSAKAHDEACPYGPDCKSRQSAPEHHKLPDYPGPPALGPCRVCGEPSWFADWKGPSHLCCRSVPEGESCSSCVAAEALRGGKVGPSGQLVKKQSKRGRR